MKTIIILLLTPLFLWTLTRIAIVPLLSKRSVAAGMQEGRTLASCPNKPNCVCSFDSDEGHAIEPLAFPEAGQAQWQSLLDNMASLPGWKLISKDGAYAHFESRTALMNFVDDVEVLWQPDAGLVQVRSASRLGHEDFSANANRVDMLRVLAHTTLKGA